MNRHPKTRSFDNLPSACEVGNSLPTNRRSSDPSLNEKWQEHRRSLEINIVAGSDGTLLQDTDRWPNSQLVTGLNIATLDKETEDWVGSPDVNCVKLGEGVATELSVNMVMGQMENILQEAAADSLRDTKAEHANNSGISSGAENQNSTDVDLTVVEKNSANGFEVPQDGYAKGDNVESPNETKVNVHCQSSVVNEKSHDSVIQFLHAPDEVKATENQESLKIMEDILDKCTTEEGRTLHSSFNPTYSPPNTIRAFSNGYGKEVNKEHKVFYAVPETTTPVTEVAEKHLSVLESSTETLTEDLGIRLETLVPNAISSQTKTEPVKHSLETEQEYQSAPRMLNGTCKQPSLSGFPQSFTTAKPLTSTCNGDFSDPDSSTPQRALLSRQLSLASCSCSVQRCMHLGRSHFDDDGLTLHTDVIQQRLRQIEAGHQLEVEALKRQVQELWSRLQSQHATAAQHCVNGDLGDEMVSIFVYFSLR